MKKESYAEMTSRAFKQYELDGAQLEKLHRALLVIIDDVDRVCRKYGIKYMLGSASFKTKIASDLKENFSLFSDKSAVKKLR